LPLAVTANCCCSGALDVFTLCEGAAHPPASTSKRGEVKQSQSGRLIGVPLIEVPPSFELASAAKAPGALSTHRPSHCQPAPPAPSAAELVRKVQEIARLDVVAALGREVDGLVRSVLGRPGHEGGAKAEGAGGQ